MRILVNPSLTSFPLIGNMSSFYRHFLLVSVCFIHNGEIENLRKVVFFLLERLVCFSLLEHV